MGMARKLAAEGDPGGVIGAIEKARRINRRLIEQMRHVGYNGTKGRYEARTF